MNGTFDQRQRPKTLHPRNVRNAGPRERLAREFADSYLEIARLLLAYGRTDVARRRLKRVVDKFAGTPAAAESRNLLTAIEHASEGAAADAEIAPEPGNQDAGGSAGS